MMVDRPPNHFGLQADERVVAFFDHANFTSACRMLDFRPNYRSIYEMLNGTGRLLRPHFFATCDTEAPEQPERKLFDWLDYHGFQVHPKQIRVMQDPHTGARKIKGSVNVEIACAMARYIDTADHLVLFSGDGDMLPAVEFVQDKGRRVTVVSSVKTEVPVAADALRRRADRFVELDDIADDIMQDPLAVMPARPTIVTPGRTAA